MCIYVVGINKINKNRRKTNNEEKADTHVLGKAFTVPPKS